MLQGPATDLYREVMQRFPEMHLIASGGVSGIADIEALNEAGIPAVVIGKALLEGRITLNELNRFM
jgi:phosphoribosylformimino-5-aminoimidazole carboxamide ribotide isomerase